MRTRVPGWGQGPHLQLQPAGWLCPRPVDEGPPEPLLTVRSVAGRSPVDEVAQVLQTEDRLTGLRSSPPPPPPETITAACPGLLRPALPPTLGTCSRPSHPHPSTASGLSPAAFGSRLAARPPHSDPVWSQLCLPPHPTHHSPSLFTQCNCSPTSPDWESALLLRALAGGVGSAAHSASVPPAPRAWH